MASKYLSIEETVEFLGIQTPLFSSDSEWLKSRNTVDFSAKVLVVTGNF